MTEIEVRINLRLRGKDAERFLLMKKTVENRLGPVQITAMVRELMGIDQQKKITDSDKRILSGLRDSLPEEKHVGRSETFGVVDIPKRPRGRKVN